MQSPHHDRVLSELSDIEIEVLAHEHLQYKSNILPFQTRRVVTRHKKSFPSSTLTEKFIFSRSFQQANKKI